MHLSRKSLKRSWSWNSRYDEKAAGFALFVLTGTEDGGETIIAAIGCVVIIPGKDKCIYRIWLRIIRISTIKNAKFTITLNSKVKERVRTAAEQIDYLEELVNKYPITIAKMVWTKATGDGWKLLLNVLVVVRLLVTTSAADYLSRGIEENANSHPYVLTSLVLYWTLMLSKWRKKLLHCRCITIVQVAKLNRWHRKAINSRDNQDWFTFTYRPWSLNTTTASASKINFSEVAGRGLTILIIL